jgi:hypothetical protein
MSDLQIPLLPEYSSQISTEQNLEEYPLFELKARQRGTKARVFEREIAGEDGISLNQVWKVMPSGEYGMPGPVDQDVYLAVLQLLQQRGGMPENGELRFSLYELRKVLRWADDSGKAYKQMRDSLLRIATTSVQSKQAFYSAQEKRRITDTFNVWSVHFAEHEVGGVPVRERHVLRFHPIFIKNYIAQYLKGLDADFYWSLRSPLSKRLYRLVDLQRAGGISWKTDLFRAGPSPLALLLPVTDKTSAPQDPRGVGESGLPLRYRVRGQDGHPLQNLLRVCSPTEGSRTLRRSTGDICDRASYPGEAPRRCCPGPRRSLRL